VNRSDRSARFVDLDEGVAAAPEAADQESVELRDAA
jgi:hypothetical protein